MKKDSGYKPMGEVIYDTSTPGDYHRATQSQKKIAKSVPLNKPIQKGDGTIEGSHFRRSSAQGEKTV
jgi:hypothetical protein